MPSECLEMSSPSPEDVQDVQAKTTADWGLASQERTAPGDVSRSSAFNKEMRYEPRGSQLERRGTSRVMNSFRSAPRGMSSTKHPWWNRKHEPHSVASSTDQSSSNKPTDELEDKYVPSGRSLRRREGYGKFLSFMDNGSESSSSENEPPVGIPSWPAWPELHRHPTGAVAEVQICNRHSTR